MKRKKKRSSFKWTSSRIDTQNPWESFNWGATPWGNSDYIYRRVQWNDVKENLLNLLTITKDFLLIKSRSFLKNSTSTSASSTSGCTVKLVPSSNVTIETQGNLFKRAGYTNTTSSGGYQINGKGRNLYGTKIGTANIVFTPTAVYRSVRRSKKRKKGRC